MTEVAQKEEKELVGEGGGHWLGKPLLLKWLGLLLPASGIWMGSDSAGPQKLHICSAATDFNLGQVVYPLCTLSPSVKWG